MWAVINKKGNFNIEHTHPNNYLSAAYYVKAPKNCGKIKFLNPVEIAKIYNNNKVTCLSVLTEEDFFLSLIHI